MLAGRLTQTTLRALDWLSAKVLPPDETAEHLKTGRRGEEEAYFHLRRQGYTIIARNYRSPNHRGELDLVGWVRDKKDDKDVLCFIEVKTRTTRAIQPAEAAVDPTRKTTSAASPTISCATCPIRASRDLTCSRYIMTAASASPHSSCFKMRF